MQRSCRPCSTHHCPQIGPASCITSGDPRRPECAGSLLVIASPDARNIYRIPAPGPYLHSSQPTHTERRPITGIAHHVVVSIPVTLNGHVNIMDVISAPVSHRTPSALRVSRIALCVTRSPFHRQVTLVRASPATLPQSLQPITPRSLQTTPRASPQRSVRLARHQGSGSSSLAPP